MANLANDIRLAVDSGKVAIGFKSVMDTITSSAAKMVIIAKNSEKDTRDDVLHNLAITDIRHMEFTGTSMELGAVCGKPFPVSALSILEEGNSKILKENYTKEDIESAVEIAKEEEETKESSKSQESDEEDVEEDSESEEESDEEDLKEEESDSEETDE